MRVLALWLAGLVALGAAQLGEDATPEAGAEGEVPASWRDDVLRLAESMGGSKAGAGSQAQLFPWVAKANARKAFTKGMAEGKKKIMAGEGEPVPREEPLVLTGSPVTGSVAKPGSIVAVNEAGFLVSRAHGGLKTKRKMCMRCRIVYDANKGVSAALGSLQGQLDSAMAKGAELQGANADAIASRLGMARATGDGFYGMNPRSRARRQKDEALRKCLVLPEGPDRAGCLSGVNGRKQLVEDPHAVFEPGLVFMPAADDGADKRRSTNDPSKEFNPDDADTTQPATDTSAPFGSALLQEGARRGPPLSPVGVSESLFREMVEQEPEAMEEPSAEGGTGSVTPHASGGAQTAPSKDQLMAAVAQGALGLSTKRFPVVGSMAGLSAGDLVDARPGSGASVALLETELCLNEGSRAFVYAVWRGLFKAKFDGADVGCVDSDP